MGWMSCFFSLAVSAVSVMPRGRSSGAIYHSSMLPCRVLITASLSLSARMPNTAIVRLAGRALRLLARARAACGLCATSKMISGCRWMIWKRAVFCACAMPCASASWLTGSCWRMICTAATAQAALLSWNAPCKAGSGKSIFRLPLLACHCQLSMRAR